MNEFQYCYWLMGIFELNNPQTFNAKQIYLIKEHLNLVTLRQHKFCNWLESFLNAHSDENIGNDELKQILNKLSSEFLHIIDKSYPEELWVLLQKAHDGKL